MCNFKCTIISTCSRLADQAFAAARPRLHNGLPMHTRPSAGFDIGLFLPQTENVFNCSRHQRLVTVVFWHCFLVLTYLLPYKPRADTIGEIRCHDAPLVAMTSMATRARDDAHRCVMLLLLPMLQLLTSPLGDTRHSNYVSHSICNSALRPYERLRVSR